ncbi:MAG TPA: DUF3500 domain-containing protein [Saprospiraceae bacterium]|nr:DUF3500 domain-containing protein [Saprospiraceae bacterium]HNT19112.1 DUF3500 domain-containing protein [Saprospiraceae bacterium]
MKRFLLAGFMAIQAAFAGAQSGKQLISSTRHFVQTLSPDELKKAAYSFEDTLRKKWTNLPVGLVPRPGIRYGDLSDQSRMAFHRVLSSLLSSQGYLKLTSIMQLDDILNVLYQEAFDQGKINRETFTQIRNLKWEHGNYYISVWGQPQEKEAWGLSFGGHHIALSCTVKGEHLSLSPLFVGTDPSEIKSSKYAGWRVLSKEEDYGFMLVNMLSESQQSKAILKREVPGDIITNPNSSQRISEYYGIAAGEFNEAQRSLLEILIQEYIHNFEHAFAHDLYSRILKTGLNKIYFAWVGSLEINKPHYYILHGPDFLIEYDNVGFQNDGNHIHAILRETGNDFGEDILKKHYLESKH